MVSGNPRQLVVSLALVGLALLVASVPAAAGPFGGIQRLFKNWGLFDGVQVTGTNSLTLQQNRVEGSTSAWLGQRWDTDPVVRTSSLGLEGPIWKEFKFRADLSSSGYGTSYTRWMVGYEGNDSALYYGDLNVDLSGNQFATFNKAVSGWQLDQRVGRGLARAFYSQAKAITRYQTFQGNNTSGPFFLSYTPVVEGTEVVKVNEELQVLGEDYKLDYQSGQLYFEPDGKAPKIIPDTATVTVSYESSGYQSDSGTVYGARAEVPLLGDRMRLGMTMVKQMAAGSGASANDTVGYQEDTFTGSGSTGPFDVNYRPIIADGTQVVYQGVTQTLDQALIVEVDDVPKVDGVDYDSYRSIGRVIFRYAISPLSKVVIKYYYDLGSTSETGDQSVMGLDMTYALSPKVNLQAEYGHSSGASSDATGDAMRANLTYSPSDRLQLATEYRNTQPTFSYMDTSGYYQQDRGLETTLRWRPTDHISFGAHRSDVKSANGYTFGYGSTYSSQVSTTGVSASDTTTTLAVQSTRDDLELKLEYPQWPVFTISREQLSNNSQTSGNNDYTSMSYEFDYSPQGKPFTLRASLEDTDQARVYSATSSDTTNTATNTRQFNWAATYQPGSRLSVSLNRGQNTSKSLTTDDRSSSSTSQLSVRWTPSSKLDFNFDRTLSSSVGSLSSLTTSATSSSLDTADDTDTDTEDNHYEDNRSEFKASYRPSSKLNFDFNLSKRRYTSGGTVGYLADSDQTTQSLSALWQLSTALALNATIGTDKTNYLESGRGAVTNDQFALGANYKVPNSPWALSLTYNSQDGSSPVYSGYGEDQRMYVVANKLSDLRGQVTYSLSETSDIVLTGELAKCAGGYSNFNQQQAEIGFRHKLGNLADVTVGYRFIRKINLGAGDPRYSGDDSLTPGDESYLLNTFLVTFTSQFSGSVGDASRTGSLGGGMYGSSSLSNFGGYRVGAGTSSGLASGTLGTGFSSSSGFGSSSYGSFSGFGGDTSGFSTGLGAFTGAGNRSQSSSGTSGQWQPGPTGPPGSAGPAAPTGEAPEVEDWHLLDDLLSVWW